MTFRNPGFASVLLALAVGLLYQSVMAQGFVPPASGQWDWCGTQRVFEQKYRARYGAALAPEACDQYGPCDDPVERDLWIPSAGGPVQTIKMIIHVLARDDGSNPFSTPAHVAGQMAELNANYAPAGIRFDYEIDYVNSSAWRSLAESEIEDMKIATAIEPDQYLNVWVTVVEFDYSFGTFPWSPDALEATGGIVMGHFHWVDLPNRVFAHEVGHTLGLYHTFHGVDEVTACGACYETPQSNSSLIGDLCADTPPTPTNQGPCNNFGGSDPCSGLAWGYTMPENYMGYATQYCLTTFTPEQRGRLRCWSNGVLDNWVIPFQLEATPILGPAPLAVDFAAATHKASTNWEWDFGDDAAATGVSSPSHVYTEPGLRTVTVDMQTSENLYQRRFEGLVSVYADTLDILDNKVQGSQVSVLVYCRNYLPLKSITLPIAYAGDFDLRFDSVSIVGLRSSHMSRRTLSWVENQNKAAVAVEAVGTDYLTPGFGPVLKICFTNLQPQRPGSVPVVVTSYGDYNVVFTAPAGSYAPACEDGTIVADCCRGIVGDANSDGGYEPTISDVSILIDHLFISGIALDCYLEADVNQSGGSVPTREDVSIGDVSALIDYLFVTGTPIPACQ